MSANSRPLVATLYNPHTQSKEALIAGFIVRKRLFERLFRDIHTAPMAKPEQHYLIQGIRGMGKTTLLLRLAYEVENAPELRNQLIPIVFNEEEYGIGSLADVWERVAKYLEEADSSFSDIYQAITGQFGQEGYERQAFELLTLRLRQHKKKLLLLIDNIGDILRKLDKQEEQRLREVLLTSPDLRIIGATPVLIEQFHDYTRPFYEFFKVIHLEGLSREEAPALFLKLGETYHTEAIQQIVKHQPGRIEAIRRLTGGVIRTMVLLYEILVENGNGTVFRDLQVLLDRVTPLYKHRMDDLPPQQQKIVVALAQAWDAASTKELSQTVRLESKVISAQLTQLIHNRIVEKIETGTKNHLYRLEERFFNIWYLMRFGRTTDQRVLWLVRFFEEMFGDDPEWMQERINQHLAAIEKGEFDPEAAFYLSAALRKFITDEELEDIISKTTRIYLTKTGRMELAEEIGSSQLEKVTDLIENRLYEESIQLLNGFKKKTALVYLDTATCYHFLYEYKYQQEIEMALYDFYKNRLAQNWVKKEFYYGEEKEATYTFISGIISNLFIDRSGNKGISWHLTSSGSLSLEIAISYFFIKAKYRKQIAYDLVNLASEATSYTDGKIDNMSHDEYLSFSIVKNIIYLWNNAYAQVESNFTAPTAYQNSSSVIESEEKIKKEFPDIIRPDLWETFLKLLLAKKQYHTAYHYFQQEEWQLKDRFKPLYYATLHYLRDEYPTDYLRMGPELKETVEDVIKEVEQMAIDYA
ncbi:hypothetical protein ACS5NO_21990 [Larkinella sp. GY13]|uniref:hypothetical protein n=1 Tax=Larkinella sp. GY13 TaxID=3453720 RepID=UPI003EEF4D5B